MKKKNNSSKMNFLLEELQGVTDITTIHKKIDSFVRYSILYPNMVILKGYRLLEFGEMMETGDKFWTADDRWSDLTPPFEKFSESFRPMIRKKCNKYE